MLLHLPQMQMVDAGNAIDVVDLLEHCRGIDRRRRAQHQDADHRSDLGQ
ncbi:MAG: hypothetical protein R3E68_14575 [Burkholderiaceae bacterium]